jgi:galactokinase
MTQWANPEIIASAPGRINLIGEHIDFCEGFVIPYYESSCLAAGTSRFGAAD